MEETQLREALREVLQGITGVKMTELPASIHIHFHGDVGPIIIGPHHNAAAYAMALAANKRKTV